jgi:hypothetical protein
LVIRLKEEINELPSPFSSIDKASRWAFTGYPTSTKCEIVGWMNAETLCVKKNANISYLVGYAKEFHHEMYKKFIEMDYKRNGLDVRED